MSPITGILGRIKEGDPNAAEELLPLVYDELRRLAASKMVGQSPGQTLQATALVHEAWLKLVEAPPVHGFTSHLCCGKWNVKAIGYSLPTELSHRALTLSRPVNTFRNVASSLAHVLFVLCLLRYRKAGAFSLIGKQLAA